MELGLAQERRGEYFDAEKLRRNAWKVLAKTCGPTDIKTLQSLNCIGCALYRHGQYEATTTKQQEC